MTRPRRPLTSAQQEAQLQAAVDRVLRNRAGRRRGRESAELGVAQCRLALAGVRTERVRR